MSDEGERSKGFHIRSVLQTDGRWVARIRKAGGSSVSIDLSEKLGRRVFLDTSAPDRVAKEANRARKDGYQRRQY
jgi:hypothetical protein